MEMKNLKNAVDNFVPNSEFKIFFGEWKDEQKRRGFNWSIKSEEFFREAMITGMVFLNSTSKVKEAVQESPPFKGIETGRVRARQEPIKEEPRRTRNKEVGNTETSDTIIPSNRTRTRTRI